VLQLPLPVPKCADQPRNTAAFISISSVAAKLSTAYTTDPGWSSFVAAASSFESEYSRTQTHLPPGTAFLSSAASVVLTASDQSAAISSIAVSHVQAADEDSISAFVQFVSTQTYLEEGAGNSLHSDLTVFTALLDSATATTRSSGASQTTPSVAPRTVVTSSTAVVTRTQAVTPAAATTGLSTTAKAGAAVALVPGMSGAFAGAFVGFIALVGLL